jgi:hypothetical protein
VTVPPPLSVLPSTGGVLPPEPGCQTVKWTRNAADFPDGSLSVPARTCRPVPIAPVLKTMCVPVTTGATVAAPSSVTFAVVAGSLATSSIELADATVEPSAGVDETSVGAVLSMRMLVRTSWDVFPTESETTARRS